ncbi:MAG: HAD family hydrolase [Hespellia sp.]|nr:HAD family hydrolase [Hespellia sp.]
MIKLIASDLDGTLLQNGAQAITPRAIDLIQKLTAQGVRFVAASGRQYNSMKTLFAPVKDDISFVCENGSLAIDHDEVLFRGGIDEDLVRRIIEELLTQTQFDITVSREDSMYVTKRSSSFIDHLRDVVHNDLTPVDNLLDYTDNVIKIAIGSSVDGAHIVDKYQKHLQDMFGREIKVVTSGNRWIDFIAPNTNKAVALEKLVEHYGIDPKDCIAFGDQYNDVEMLQYVGTSYAMANAAPGISYYSTDVTDSVEDVLEDLLCELDD